jgi:hypothetical protein
VTEATSPGAGATRRWTGPLAVVAILVTAGTLGLTVAVAGDTLGYDFRAYRDAAVRLLAGGPLYDTTIVVAGPFGQFLYPPPAVLVGVPFTLVDQATAIVAWTVLLIAAAAAAIAILPVSARARWTVLLLAGLSWPFLYSVKLGQVGPVLLLLFAIGWRWMDRPWVTGTAIALGAALKVQPVILLGWAVLARRWRIAAAAVVALAVLAIAGVLVGGTGAWPEFVGLLGRISDPVATPHNMTAGAVAYQLGVSREAATLLQWAVMGGVVLLVVLAALRWSAVPSYLVAVVASQALSPVLWDHYAMILLLPVAWLLDRGRWIALGAAVVPLLSTVLLAGRIPPATYPVAFGLTLLLIAVEAEGERRPAQATTGSSISGRSTRL